MPRFELPDRLLFPVANDVKAGIIMYDGTSSPIRAKFRQAIPRFLGSLGTVHGAKFPLHRLNAVMEVMDHKIMNAELLQVRLGKNGPVLDAALATGAPNLGVDWDKNHNLKVYPVYHGEDLCVDQDVAVLFREYTKCLLYPNGVGMGSWFMREQILRSIDDPDWVFAGRDNEHFPKNAPIRCVMDKFGAIHGTERDSSVLQISELEPRFGVANVTKVDLPADALGITSDPNNFLVRWGQDGDPQQVAATFRRLASTFDAEPVVWVKIKSHGKPLEKSELKEVLYTILSVATAEIKSPERLWGVPLENSKDKYDYSHIFGGPMPIMHIHANNEPGIIEALLEMDAERRMFGHEWMVSGSMKLKNIIDPKRAVGRDIPNATEVAGIRSDRNDSEPYFAVVEDIKKGMVEAVRKASLLVPSL